MLAFFALGLQSAAAQYVPAGEALSLLDGQVTALLNAPAVHSIASESDANASTELKIQYFKGVAVSTKTTQDVGTAINNNHLSFLERHPAFQTVATQYRTEVQALLTE